MLFQCFENGEDVGAEGVLSLGVAEGVFERLADDREDEGV